MWTWFGGMEARRKARGEKGEGNESSLLSAALPTCAANVQGPAEALTRAPHRCCLGIVFDFALSEEGTCLTVP